MSPEFDVAEANQLLAAAEKRIMWLRATHPSEERQLAIEATRSAIRKLREWLGISPLGLEHRPTHRCEVCGEPDDGFHWTEHATTVRVDGGGYVREILP